MSIRPRRADAKLRQGSSRQGRLGAARSAAQGRVHWAATLLAGRPRRLADLHWQQRRGASSELWLVIVDASASTRRHQALTDAKGVLAQLFDDAYRQRARLALLTASGARPVWQRHGLKASAALQPWLAALGAGGGTPLLQALAEATVWLGRRRQLYPDETQRCLIMTDGRLKSMHEVAALECPTLLLDMEKGPIRLGRARELAVLLGAEYRHLEELAVP